MWKQGRAGSKRRFGNDGIKENIRRHPKSSNSFEADARDRHQGPHPTKERLRRRTARGVILAGILVLLTALMPREGRAAAGFFGTMGISVAVGAVLGASTLPFYEQPSDHMSNIYVGAAAGAAVGLGIVIYGLIKGGPSDEEKFYFDRSKEFESGSSPGARPGQVVSRIPIHRSSGVGLDRFLGNRLASAGVTRPASFTMPLVSLTW